ncbi:MAG: hypothetical protein AVDCRST_MAG95-1212 [uncultured Adhaeribacter sp.]|uniref:Uncharacterized protein n=1 Tax=uncultured Adhaeribacter sp. TaxID=448109 RepID=A0A6J4HZI5_9BACT|nr:MAG: hypothetical protein AVDCRST_MAG95-1212 [uncultured Adhaeribacter sp.]
MTNIPLSKVEIVILYLIFGLITFGIVLSRTDLYWFEFTYTAEDSFIEWMTVLPLLLSLAITLRRLVRVYSRGHWLFAGIMLGLAAFCFFAAGEELSWGQRLFKLQSSAFFQENNSQRETNFHNLIINGYSINLLVFSRLIILMAVFYLLVLPQLYQRKAFIRKWVDRAGLPVARGYQVLAFLAVFALISLCPSGKRAELLEFGGCFLFYLLVRYPLNAHIYTLAPKPR